MSNNRKTRNMLLDSIVYANTINTIIKIENDAKDLYKDFKNQSYEDKVGITSKKVNTAENNSKLLHLSDRLVQLIIFDYYMDIPELVHHYYHGISAGVNFEDPDEATYIKTIDDIWRSSQREFDEKRLYSFDGSAFLGADNSIPVIKFSFPDCIYSGFDKDPSEMFNHDEYYFGIEDKDFHNPYKHEKTKSEKEKKEKDLGIRIIIKAIGDYVKENEKKNEKS